ncbi:hypothetical protein KC950_03910 [Candidatus Saccharibacteria bacterium]|nr:hypothetical protein [Candidatus Saccharibacteria bacterium]
MPIQSTTPDLFPDYLRGDQEGNASNNEDLFADTNILSALLNGEVSLIPQEQNTQHQTVVEPLSE